MKQRLTDKQLAVFCYAQEFFKENDQLPPLQKVADHFGRSHTNSALSIMKSLEAKGYLERNAVGKYRFARERIE